MLREEGRAGARAGAQRTWANWRGSRKTSASGAQRVRGAVLGDEVGQKAEAVLYWSEREFGFNYMSLGSQHQAFIWFCFKEYHFTSM